MTLWRAARSCKRRSTSARLRGLRTAALVHGSVLGVLLLPATSLPAATHPTHGTHHGSVVSAGKASAHAVRDDETTTSRHSGKTTQKTKDAVSSKASKSSAHSRHAEEDKSKNLSRSGSRSSRKHQAPPPPEDPQPVMRAHGKRNAHEDVAQTARLAHTRRTASHTPELKQAATHSSPQHTGHSAPETPSETAHIGTALTESDFLRGMHSAPPAEVASSPQPSSVFATGTAHPDEDERLPMHIQAMTSANQHTQRSAPAVHARTASIGEAIVTAAPDVPVPTPRRSEPVVGFGGEVEYATTPTVAAARAPAVPLPRETPAEQERDLRTAADDVNKPLFVPLYDRDGKLVVPPPLKGSHEILVHQNQMADDAGLSRIQDDDDLDRMRRARLLTDFAETASLHINESLPANRRSARPWTVRFANDVAHAYFTHFGVPLQLNSAVRTVAYQLRLQRVNGNAAAVDGDGASPHLTGQAIDFGKRGMSIAQIAWMRSYLLPLIDAGKIDVEEEFQQACFHISVYSSYMPAPKSHPAHTELAGMPKAAAHSHAAATPAPDADGDMR